MTGSLRTKGGEINKYDLNFQGPETQDFSVICLKPSFFSFVSIFANISMENWLVIKHCWPWEWRGAMDMALMIVEVQIEERVSKH